jgi:hypothetical protein
MSVAEHPVEPMHDASTAGIPLDSQAAIELAHELVLVTRATFAQLLPETSERAISGVPGLGVDAPEVPQQTPVPSAHTPSASVLIAAAPQPAPVPVSPAPVAASPVTPHPVPAPSVTVPHAAAAPAPVAVPLVVAHQDEPGSEAPSHEVAVPTIPLSVPAAPATTEAPLDYVPVPGVESPTAANMPVVPAVQPAEEIPVAETPTVHRPQHLSLAMLEEIGFLDE